MAKHWCFTLNNYSSQEIETTRLLKTCSDYLVFGFEVGEKGTPHLQGFISFDKRMTIKKVAQLLSRAHWVPARGSPEQNRVYCTKDNKFEEFGLVPLGQTGAATLKRKADYDVAVDLAKKQKLYEVDSSMLLRFGSSLRSIQKDFPLALDPLDTVTGVWLWGKPGVGKSRTARWLYPNAYPKPLNKWWDGYQNEEFIILDDFDFDHRVLGHHLKQWSDHYAFTAEQKGTSIRIRPQIICVTSNYAIEQIFLDSMLCDAIKRRFIEIEMGVLPYCYDKNNPKLNCFGVICN